MKENTTERNTKEESIIQGRTGTGTGHLPKEDQARAFKLCITMGVLAATQGFNIGFSEEGGKAYLANEKHEVLPMEILFKSIAATAEDKLRQKEEGIMIGESIMRTLEILAHNQGENFMKELRRRLDRIEGGFNPYEEYKKQEREITKEEK